MINEIGELLLQSGRPLLKMWSIDVPKGPRPYVRHSHPRFEITVVNSGRGEYTTERGVYPMEKGDVFVFSSNEVHCITACGEDGLGITNLHFEPRYLDDDSFFVNFCFSHSPEFKNRIPSERAAVIRRNHALIASELAVGDELNTVAVRSYLNLILIDLFRNQCYRVKAVGEGDGCAFNMLAVYDYIEQHFCDELTLGELSELVHLSPNYFCHLFKQYNGITLWEYITAKRIEKAVRLIRARESKLTVMDIALQCGFNNTAGFNKAFKKHTGITPTQLRKNPKLFTH